MDDELCNAWIVHQYDGLTRVFAQALDFETSLQAREVRAVIVEPAGDDDIAELKAARRRAAGEGV